MKNKNIPEKKDGMGKRAGRPPSAETVNEMKFTVPSLSVNEGFSRAAVGAFIAQLDPTALEISDVKCGLSEAVTNCTVHAYPDRIGKINVRVRLFADRSVKIEVRDSGVGISDVEAAREPLFTTDAAGERSGMGFTVMEAFMDSVRVYSRPGKGTLVVLDKKVGQGENPGKKEEQSGGDKPAGASLCADSGGTEHD